MVCIYSKEWKEARENDPSYEEIAKTRPLTPEENYWRFLNDGTLVEKLDEFEKKSREKVLIIGA